MKKLLIILALIIVLSVVTITVSGHPGRTDSDGGHYDRTTGKYHWHHGTSAHQHYDMDGDGDLDCPHSFKDNTETNINTESTTETNSNTESTNEQPTEQSSPDVSTAQKTGKISDGLMTAIIVAVVLVGSWVVWIFFIKH